jgi:membrane protein implicated in regulation of membrane protease activity
MAAIVIGALAVWLLRSRPGAAYVAAIVTLIAGSPVVQITWFTILLGALAPLVWPMPAEGDVPVESTSATTTDRAVDAHAPG